MIFTFSETHLNSSKMYVPEACIPSMSRSKGVEQHSGQENTSWEYIEYLANQ